MGQWIDKLIDKKVSEERRKRIQLSVYAYAYECMHDSIISDHDYDKLSKEIDTSIDTGHKVLDAFFKEQFDPSTGMWIHDHPEKDKVHDTYMKYYRRR